MPQAMSASGARYANKDETFVFWNKGDTAFVTEGKDGKDTYSGCATKRGERSTAHSSTNDFNRAKA